MGGRRRRPKSEAADGPPPQVPQGFLGVGEYDPETGLYEAYESLDGAITWTRVLDCWRLIEQDFADRGIDLADALVSRSWRWVEARIAGLLNGPPAIGPEGVALPTSRLGWELTPPKPR